MNEYNNYLPGLGNANSGLAGNATEWFKKYKKQVLLGGAVVALGAGTYFLMKSKKTAKKGTSGLSGTGRRRSSSTKRKTTTNRKSTTKKRTRKAHLQ